MASNNSNRKRNQKSKAISHQKNAQGENPNLRTRDQVAQQHWQQQPPLVQQKQTNKSQNQQQCSKQQQQQLLQQQQQQLLLQHQQQQQLLLHQHHQQQSNSTSSKTTLQIASIDTSILNNTVKPRTTGPESYNKRKHSKTTQQEGISNISLHAAIFWRRLDLVESLLQNGSTAWEVDQHGNTAFMTACKVGDIKLMSTLWDSASANLNIQHSNREGDTSLHVCAGAGQEECCRFLISRHAKVNTKNKTKDTPLHLAAKCDHVNICNMLLNSAASSANDALETHRFILEENDKGQTAVCVSILHQHAQITRMLLDMLTPKEQAIYLSTRLQRALKETLPTVQDLPGAAIPGSQEVFLHGLLVSLSVLLICFAERTKQDCSEFNILSDSRVDQCLSDTKLVQTIVGIASNRYVNKQIVPISCFLLIYLMEGVPEYSEIHKSDEMTLMSENEIPPTGRKFLEQFLNCNGPNDLLLKVNNGMELSEPHDSVITIALALTIVSLVRSTLGRSWLESNRCHLTFLKEILLQNRSILSLLTTTCPLLTISYLESICREFVKQVEVLEARDREQNLAELLWEEERDRKRRERKKHKQQQKKQNSNKDAKNKNVALQPLQIIEVSSDDEMCYHLTDGNLVVRGKPELFVEDKPGAMDQGKSSNECHVTGQQSRDSTCNNFDDEISSTGGESRFIKSGNEKSGFPSTQSESTSELIKDVKAHSEESVVVGVTDLKQETGQAEKYQGKESGGTPTTMMRWADVAKLGCGTSDKSSCNLGDHAFAHSGVYSDKLCNLPLSSLSDTKRGGFEAENSRLAVNIARMDTSACNTFEDTPCYDVLDPSPTVDINSDEETSSCSSSSIDSHSHLRSNSILQNRNLSVTSDNTASHSVLVGATPKNAVVCQTSPSRGRRRRRKSKLSRKAEQKKVDIICWSPQKDMSVFYASSSSVNCEDNSIKTNSVIKPLSIVADPSMVKTRSENALNASWSSADNPFGPYSKDSDKNIAPSMLSQKCNPKRKDIVTSSTFRSEIPAILPPLKITRELNHSKEIIYSNRGDDAQTIETGDVSGGDIRSQLTIMGTQKRQSFCSKNTPLTRIKSSGVSLFKANTVSKNTSSSGVSSLCHSEALTCSNISTLTLSSSIAQSLFSTLTMSGQHTPPPPGFQLIKQPVSVQTVRDIVNLDKSMQSYNKVNNNTEGHAIVPSSGKKGRVITTVLLDKVKNPPISLQQQNKIPLLSTLAWNCGQESKVAWSKLLPSKPATATTASALDTTTTTRPLLPSSAEQSFVTSLSNSPWEITVFSDQCKMDQHNTISPSGQCTMVTGSNFETNTTFSTILMNRMQQRNHNRDSINNLDILDGKPMNDKNSQSTLSVKDLVTSSILDVSMSSMNNHDNTNQQCHQLKPNSSHQSTVFNQNNRQFQQTVDKTDTNLQTQVSSRGSLNKLGKESMDVKDFILNTQVLGKRQSTQHKSDSRCISPPVFFPEQIRDQTGSTSMNGANFPAFHEVHTSDFLSEMFSDPLFTDNIAVNQIRQKIQSSQSSTEWCDVDFDYYASLYQMKFRDVLGNLPGQNRSQLRVDRQNNTFTGSHGFKDGRDWQDNHSVLGPQLLSGNQVDVLQSRRHSLRWHRSLQKILDLLWTTRKQYGNIILPHPIPEYSIGMAGNVLIGIGFLTDGTEIAVLIVDTTLVQISPRMVEIISSPEMDKHCLTRCKSFSESSNVQYIAMDLYEYNLCEYLQVCLNQNTASDLYTGLVWQLLQALGFLHHKLCMPHGHLAPCWIFINADGHLRLAGLGITTTSGDGNKQRIYNDTNLQGYEYRTSCWGPTEDLTNERTKPSFYNDIRSAGKLAYFILTKGQHLFGAVAPMETEINLMRDHLCSEAFDLISPMLTSDPKSQPAVGQCLKHPMFWSGDKKFRLILIVGSDVLTEMRTGIALTGTGAPTMMEILSLIDINMVSPNWIHEVDSTVLKEMKSFRVYKNNLAELTLFVYNCCLHFDKLSNSAKEVLDDPCKYFQNLFPSLFMAIYRSLKSSDRTDRTCYKPFF